MNILWISVNKKYEIYRINEYNSKSIYSAYPELISTIKKTEEMLINIKYREDYICDVIFGERRQKQIIIEI